MQKVDVESGWFWRKEGEVLAVQIERLTTCNIVDFETGDPCSLDWVWRMAREIGELFR